MALFGRGGVVRTAGTAAAKGVGRAAVTGGQTTYLRVNRKDLDALRDHLTRDCDQTDKRTKDALKALRRANEAADQAELAATNQDRSRHLKRMNDEKGAAHKLWTSMTNASDKLSKELIPAIVKLESEVKRNSRAGAVRRRLRAARTAITKGNEKRARSELASAQSLAKSL